MQINGNNRVRPLAIEPATKPTSPERGSTARPEPAGANAPSRRTDSVSFSDAGRALAGGTGRAELSTERVEEVRQRLLAGAYNSTQMAEQVARRILERGDI
ncbi:MAG: flagellar biosynthesis anti-sigma factor FlgM [Gemmatimonadaceae bacterium]|jgi:anti-sigma28 factor (negative regulator of flagellin synthesis)|nr:flagellar biosynthesis anti-sigma factor FlgM [Gemmatimonadaceae bacterium]